MNFLICESIGLGNDRDEIDLGVQSAHNLNIKRLQGVTSRLNEVDASVDTVVDNVHAVDLVLCVQVCIETLLNVFHNRAPGFVVVHKVSEARRVNNSKSQTHAILLNVGADGLDGNSAGSKVEAGLLGLLWWVERRVEECVHERRLSETRFT